MTYAWSYDQIADLLQRCRALLDYAQWGTEGMCPLCKALGGEINAKGEVTQDPHAPDCELAALLRELRP